MELGLGTRRLCALNYLNGPSPVSNLIPNEPQFTCSHTQGTDCLQPASDGHLAFQGHPEMVNTGTLGPGNLLKYQYPAYPDKGHKVVEDSLFSMSP